MDLLPDTRKVSRMKTQEEFDDAESRWRAQLTGRSLVIEASADPAESEDALRILGFNYRRAGEREQKANFLFKYRAAFLVGVCSAAFRYDVHGMWPYLEETFGPLPSTDQQILSEAFRSSLDDFGLSRFTFPRRNVDEILMHAGIPGQRMDEFIELLARRDTLSDGLDGRSFCQWIGGLSRATAFTTHKLDAPTYRFLAEGREIAEDLVDRCLQLLDTWAKSGVTEADLVSFPGVMQKDLLRALDELGDKRVAPRSKARTRQLDFVPRLLFDPSSGLRVRLPPLETVTDARVEWVISAEGSTSRLTADPPWPGDPIKTGYFSVARPAKQVALTAIPGDQTWLVNVVDPDDPLLAFDSSTGEWIPLRNTLPKTSIWIAVPNPDDQTFDELIEVDGTVDAKALDEPMGWSGWLFAELSLASVSKLRRAGADLWRYVSTTARPTIEAQEVLEWARALDGASISAELPKITLPPVIDRTGSGSAIEWTVTMTRSDGEQVREVKALGGYAAKIVDLDGSDIPSTGTFDFTVKGPLGRGTSRRITLVRGLEIVPETRFRPMSALGNGLLPATVDIRSLGSATADRAMLSGSEASKVVIIAGEADIRVVIEIPAMSVTKLSNNRPITTSHSPIAIDLEELANTQLRVTCGTPGRAVLVAMKAEQLLQTVTAAALGGHGIATFNLAQLGETLFGSSGASLFVVADGDRIPVGRVRPRQLVESVALDPEDPQRMLLVGAHTDQPLEIAFYPRYAPWSGPQVTKSSGGLVSLPVELSGEGEVRVVIRVEDPWVPFEWPRDYPSRTFNTFDVTLGSLTDSRGGSEQGFRSWLQRSAPCTVGPSGLPLAISLYASDDVAKFRVQGDVLRDELARAMSVHREYLPGAYSQAVVQTAPIDLFVAAEVTTLPPSGYVHGAALWESSPLLAVLANTNSLESVSDDLDRVLGESANQILDAGIDPFGPQGRFGPNEEVLARWPADRIESVWKSVNPVPGRLLDAETRVIAAKQMFDQRARIPFDIRAAANLLAAVKSVVEKEYGDAASSPITARSGAPGWASLPTLTIAFSLVERSTGREVEGANALHKLTKPYLVAMARMSPKLVEQDLILAELWITRWSSQ